MTYMFYHMHVFPYLLVSFPLFIRLPGPLLPDPLLPCSLLSVLFSPLILPIRSAENAQKVTLIPPGIGLPSLYCVLQSTQTWAWSSPLPMCSSLGEGPGACTQTWA
jgi:hypothetical protein